MDQSKVLLQYRIPDVLANFPWPACRHSAYEQVKAESLDWMSKYADVFGQKILQPIAAQDMPLLVAEIVPTDRSKDILRAGSDHMIFFAVYDDLSDENDVELARKMHIAMMDAFRHPEKRRPDGEHVIGKMAQDLMLLIKQWIRPDLPGLKRFIQTMDDYGSAITHECGDRVGEVYMKFDDYLVLRRETVGIRACWALYDADLDIPDAVNEHPSFRRLHNIGLDIITLSNDVYSYGKEYLRYNGVVYHNSIPIVMVEKAIDINEAINFLESYMLGLVDQFMACVSSLPSWGPEVDSQVKGAVNSVAQWIRGNEVWSLRTIRYFGNQAAEVRRTKIMKISSYVSKL